MGIFSVPLLHRRLTSSHVKLLSSVKSLYFAELFSISHPSPDGEGPGVRLRARMRPDSVAGSKQVIAKTAVGTHNSAIILTILLSEKNGGRNAFCV